MFKNLQFGFTGKNAANIDLKIKFTPMIVLIACKVCMIDVVPLISLQINKLAKWLAEKLNSVAYSCLYEKGPIFDKYQELKKKHSTPDKPFLFQVIHFTTPNNII